MRRGLTLRNLVMVVSACLLCQGLLAQDTNSPAAPVVKSRVVLVRDASAVSNFSVDSAKAQALVVAGLKSLTGESDEAAAWRHFVSSNDVVGIKISTQCGPLQSTRRAVVDAIARGLRAAGVSGPNIYVFDRDPIQMQLAGYRPTSGTNGYRVVSIIDGTGWDPKSYFQNNLAGKLIWGDLLFGRDDEMLSKRSHLPKLVTGTITKLINVPVLQDHDACGLAGCLYNLSLGMVDNTRRFEMFGQRGDPMIAEICAMAAVRDKLTLNIMDGLIAGYAGGPQFKPQYSWNAGALYLSTDPVAIDALCLEAIDARRRDAKVTLAAPQATYIATAAKAGLGQSDRARIDLSEIRP
ncbi:MAG TPA: DUF362 domain-containing protein [Verrucomicrobiae bacterium]|nr:DUF362 domain-containing protein [Verrucomicrobiae bacterium]